MASNGLILLEMIKNNPCKPLLMILGKLLYFQKIFRKISRIFDGVGIFKGLKTHVPRFSQIKTWYQNVRKDLSYKMRIMRALRSNTLARDSRFCEKNMDICATLWSKFFSEYFFLDSEAYTKLSHLFFYLIGSAFVCSAFGTAHPIHGFMGIP